ncbi:MAG: hypothetical protein CMF46_02090 [Legionellales bacterium]|nr:hypothetical protein [Legionellales bacterium]|tara:strand:+ start:1714 stop:2241 length:528 start_codon:yes stop_codon:yes gene_type:complete
MSTIEYSQPTILIYRDSISCNVGVCYCQHKPIIFEYNQPPLLAVFLQPSLDMQKTVNHIHAHQNMAINQLARTVIKLWVAHHQSSCHILLIDAQRTLEVSLHDGIIDHAQNPLAFGPCNDYATASSKALGQMPKQPRHYISGHDIVQKALLICTDIAVLNKTIVGIKTIPNQPQH